MLQRIAWFCGFLEIPTRYVMILIIVHCEMKKILYCRKKPASFPIENLAGLSHHKNCNWILIDCIEGLKMEKKYTKGIVSKTREGQMKLHFSGRSTEQSEYITVWFPNLLLFTNFSSLCIAIQQYVQIHILLQPRPDKD